jgi:hypothetical protein
VLPLARHAEPPTSRVSATAGRQCGHPRHHWFCLVVRDQPPTQSQFPPVTSYPSCRRVESTARFLVHRAGVQSLEAFIDIVSAPVSTSSSRVKHAKFHGDAISMEPDGFATRGIDWHTDPQFPAKEVTWSAAIIRSGQHREMSDGARWVQADPPEPAPTRNSFDNLRGRNCRFRCCLRRPKAVLIEPDSIGWRRNAANRRNA